MISQKRGIDPKIMRCADDVLHRSGAPRLFNGVAIDVRRIIEGFWNLQVALVPNLTLAGRHLLAAYIPEFHYILVERNCIEPRQRFSMAHELGHAVLEDDFGPADTLFQVSEAFLCVEGDADPSLGDERTAGRRRRREIRANQFATRLLMPDGLVKDVWRRGRDVRAVAGELGVSMESLTYRLRDLGLTR